MNTDTTQPLAAINEWSCALACVTSLANDLGNPNDQDRIISKFCCHFPEWHFRKGLLDKTEILRLLELLDIHCRFILLTGDSTEFIETFAKRYGPYYIGGFILTHKPTNHCVRIVGVTKDIVDVMEPHPTLPTVNQYPWGHWDDKDPEFLLLCR